MPIYTYQCSECSHQFDALQKVSASPLLACPQCRKDSLQKCVTKTNFMLKGTGWYVSDFKGASSAAKSDQQPSESSLSSAVEQTQAAKSESTGHSCSADCSH